MYLLEGATTLPPLILLAPEKSRRKTPLRFLPATHVPALAPALARRLRGRKTFPLPALFPLTGCGVQVNTTAFLGSDRHCSSETKGRGRVMVAPALAN